MACYIPTILCEGSESFFHTGEGDGVWKDCRKGDREKSCSSDNLTHIPILTVFLISCINLPLIVNCFQVAEEMNQPKVLELLRAASR